MSYRGLLWVQISNVSHTKSHNLNVSRLALQLSLPNLLKPGVMYSPVHIAIFYYHDSYRYSKHNVSRFIGNYIHRYYWTGLIETHTFFWSDWWKYSNISQQSHILVQASAVVVAGTPSTGVAGCTRCSWSQVSLLSYYTWRPSGILLCLDTYRNTYCIVTSVSRYESYRWAPVSLHP